MNGETFQVELTRLIREAEANDVDVEGGWVCADEGGDAEWGIEIYEVVVPDRSTDAVSVDF